MHREGLEILLMAEPEQHERNRDPNAPQNPPQSVLNEQVRRTALWTYLTPLVVFFVGVGIVLLYWGSSPPPPDGDSLGPAATGTMGTEREPRRDRSPGGQNPDERLTGTDDEIEYRGGQALTELGEVVEESGRGQVGRRVNVQGVEVERVESPALFWARDGDVRVAVGVASGAARVQPGQTVDIVGTVERSGRDVRIRASRVTASEPRDNGGQ